MSDRNDGFTAVRWRSSTVRIVLVVLLSSLLVVSMIGAFGQATATVSFVLAEAIVLYVGYGALTRVAGPTAREIIVGT